MGLQRAAGNAPTISSAQATAYLRMTITDPTRLGLRSLRLSPATRTAAPVINLILLAPFCSLLVLAESLRPFVRHRRGSPGASPRQWRAEGMQAP